MMQSHNKSSNIDIQTEVFKTLLSLANLYTGARFEKPPTKDQAKVLQACTKIALRDYLLISIEEFDEAFSLASSGQFENINIETYYGEFTPQIFGKIMRSYLTYRRKVLGVHNEQTLLIEHQQEKLTGYQKDVLREKAYIQICEQYIDSMIRFNEGVLPFDIETDIKASWAKPLVSSGVIVFDLEEKKEILEEAKNYITNRLKNELHDKNKVWSESQSIRHTLKRIANGEKDTDYDSKVIARYSKLIIFKSFVN